MPQLNENSKVNPEQFLAAAMKKWLEDREELYRAVVKIKDEQEDQYRKLIDEITRQELPQKIHKSPP